MIQFAALSPSLDSVLVVRQTSQQHYVELVSLPSTTLLWSEQHYDASTLPPCVFVSDEEMAISGFREVRFLRRSGPYGERIAELRTVQGWDPTPGPSGRVLTLGTRERAFDPYAGRGLTRDGDDLDEPFAYDIHRDRAKIGEQIVRLHGVPARAWWMGPETVLFRYEDGGFAIWSSGLLQRLDTNEAKVFCPTAWPEGTGLREPAADTASPESAALALLATDAGVVAVSVQRRRIHQLRIASPAGLDERTFTSDTKAAVAASGLFALADAGGQIWLGRIGSAELQQGPRATVAVTALAIGETVRGDARLVVGSHDGFEWYDLEPEVAKDLSRSAENAADAAGKTAGNRPATLTQGPSGRTGTDEGPLTLPEMFDDLQRTADYPCDPRLRESLEEDDGFIPPTTARLRDKDVETLLWLASRAERKAASIDYYALYYYLIAKIALFALERWPAAYRRLAPSDRHRLLGAKMSLPNERAVYDQIYAYFQGDRPLGFGVFPTPLTFDLMLDVWFEEEPERFDPRLKEILLRIDGEYRSHFYSKRG